MTQPLMAETLARMRVCLDAGRSAPIDLMKDAIACLERSSDAATVRAARDALIRRAALLLPPAPRHKQASQLAQEARLLSRTWHVLKAREPASPYVTPRDCLHAAALRAKLPESHRQFYRVLRSFQTDMDAHGVVSGNAATMDA